MTTDTAPDRGDVIKLVDRTGKPDRRIASMKALAAEILEATSVEEAASFVAAIEALGAAFSRRAAAVALRTSHGG